ncbi:hypothetical protein C0J52_03221 [Blattella germanica]|nr:hypothetical protein C0J52_03221 [Blattella germanica]
MLNDFFKNYISFLVRLATKLLRLIAEQKRDIPTGQRRDYEMENVVMEQQQQLRELQQSNCHLQNKITVLRNQLAEHSTMHSASHCSNKPRSSSRSPARRNCTSNPRIETAGSSHGPPNMFQNQSTSLCLKEKQISNPKGRSSCGCHTKKQIADVPQCQIITDVQIDSDDLQQKEQLSQEEMIAQRDQSRMRIGELEESLAHCMANDKRQKVAENVEMIRLRRSLQQQSAQMAANAAKIQVLEKEVEQLQQELLVSQQENDELQGEICKERQKIVDIHENLQGAESDRLSIRELEEQIRDLQVSQLEGMLSHQNCECARLKQQLEIAKQMAVQSQNTQEKDKDIQSQVKQLESELAAERKEKSNLMQLLNDMQSLVTKLKHKVVEESTDKENHLRSQVMTLENKLSTMLKERMEADRNLEKEQAKVEALERTQTDLCNKLKYLEAQQSKSQKQLDIDEKQCVCPEPRIPSLEESRSARGKRKLSFTSDVPISSDISDEMKEFDTSHTMESNTEASEVTSEKGIDSGTKSEETLVSEENEELSENNEDFSKKSENSQLSNISERTDESISEESEKSSIKKSIYEADESLRIDSEEISSMAAVPGDSRNKDCMSETADKIDICRELEKCRELLRVQYNLNSLYKKEVANLALRLNEKQVEKAKKEDKKSEQEEKEIDKSMSPSHLVPPGIEEEPPGRLTIKHGEGVFEIHIQSMQLFPESFQNLTCKPSPSEVPGLFLTWIFYNQDVAYTPVKKIEYDIEFDSSSVYRGECTVEVHMTVDDASEPIGKGKIDFSELLEFPQNKIHTSVSVFGINKQQPTAFFGVIQCWYRLSCSVQIINDFAHKKNVAGYQVNRRMILMNEQVEKYDIDTQGEMEISVR